MGLSIFGLVYALIVLRHVGTFQVPLWAAMTVGAILMVASGVLSLSSAYAAINPDVMIFLFGMFSIVAAMEVSGLLHYIALKILSFADSPKKLLALTLFGTGLLSALFVNDTIALLWTPIVLAMAKQVKVNPKPFLIALAFGITIGSAMTPIGNPQNLLVAVYSGMEFPFFAFLGALALPTLISLGLTYLILVRYYRADLSVEWQKPGGLKPEDAISDRRLAKTSELIIVLALVGFLLAETFRAIGFQMDIRLSTVALVGGLATYVLSTQRKVVALRLDWSVLVFFAAMFIVMQGVWSSGVISDLLRQVPSFSHLGERGTISSILLASLIGPQLLSNVPFVALYSLLMSQNGFGSDAIKPWLALAAGSTISGNLTILAAASNVIIISAAESHGEKAFSFYEFFKIGLPVTAVSMLVYAAFLLI